MKTVITLTSWKKRINCLYNFLYIFFKTQKQLPDIFYIWLSIDEFPNKEKDLDEKLVKLINEHNINLIWQEGNEKVFKRWYVYPKHYNDLVISIDDDRIYPFDLINEAHKVKEGTIQRLFTTDIQPKESVEEYIKLKNHFNFCGQSIIPPNTFPCECMNEEFTALRHKLNIECDEVWISPFLKNKNVIISEEKMKFSYNLLENVFWENQENGMWLDFKKRHYEKINHYDNLVNILNTEYGFNIT